MEPFLALTAVAVPLLRDNVDTDAIIPSREMRTVSKRGLAAGLFAGWRYRAVGIREPDPDFVLNDPAYAGAHILIAGANFGCGSSREHAVWALAEYGFRAIVAPSFNPIFRGNCIANGVVPVVLPAPVVAALAAEVAERPGAAVTVDLIGLRVSGPEGAVHAFDMDEESRQALIAGADPIDRTLAIIDEVRSFIDEDVKRRPWAYSRRNA